MSVTLSPYGNATYGFGSYGGIQVSSFGFFDTPSSSFAPLRGASTTAGYDSNSGSQVRTV